jgi:hypothetical protein
MHYSIIGKMRLPFLFMGGALEGRFDCMIFYIVTNHKKIFCCNWTFTKLSMIFMDKIFFKQSGKCKSSTYRRLTIRYFWRSDNFEKLPNWRSHTFEVWLYIVGFSQKLSDKKLHPLITWYIFFSFERQIFSEYFIPNYT